MHEALFPRLSDKNVAVRAAAVEACALLQDTGDEKDELTKKVRDGSRAHPPLFHTCVTNPEIPPRQLLDLCAHDPSPVVRAASTKNLAITRYTLPTLICRVRDTSSSVRVAALDVLKNGVDCRLMTDLERVVVLRSGLTPRCDVTYLAASRMLCCGWLKR